MSSVELTAAGGAGPQSRLRPGTRTPGEGELVLATSRSPERSRRWTAVVLGATIAAGVAGAVLLAVSQRLDAHGAAPSTVDVVFWAGLLVAVLPTAAVVLARDATATARWVALTVVAVVTVLPVGLRSAGAPVTWDDLLLADHLGALRDGAPLFVARLAPAVADQPGLATLTATVWRVSGLTVWQSAVLVVLVAHVVAVLGVRALGRALGFGDRAAVAGALVWTAGPGVLVASSQVGGGALGLALLVWALTAVVQAATSAAAGRRLAWTAFAVGAAAGTAVTDVTAAWTLVGLTLLFVLATVGVTGPPVRGALVRRGWWPAAVGVLVVTVAWTLTDPGRRVLGDLDGVTDRLHRGWVGPDLSGWRIGVAVAALVAALALAAAGLARYRSRRGEVGIRYAVLGGALFPVSVLGLVAAPTTTLAHTLWPVLTAVLAPLAGGGLLVVWDLGARRTRAAVRERSAAAAVRQVQRDTRAGRVTGTPAPGGADRRLPLPVAATAALAATALVFLGGVGVSVATDAAQATRATSAGDGVPVAEVLALADRLAALAGPGAKVVVTDPGVTPLLTSLTAVTVVSVPLDAGELAAAGVEWVVDRPAARPSTLAATPWLVQVAASAHLVLDRVRPALADLDVVPVSS